jgi:hypothetical protein
MRAPARDPEPPARDGEALANRRRPDRTAAAKRRLERAGQAVAVLAALQLILAPLGPLAQLLMDHARGRLVEGDSVPAADRFRDPEPLAHRLARTCAHA